MEERILQLCSENWKTVPYYIFIISTNPLWSQLAHFDQHFRSSGKNELLAKLKNKNSIPYT